MAQYEQLVQDMRERKVHHRGADLHDWSSEEFIGLSAHLDEARSEILGQEVGEERRRRGGGKKEESVSELSF
jgi:hypothetical protein